jgi:hypothetical protein
MIVLGESSREELVFHWLRSEWQKLTVLPTGVPPSSVHGLLIDNADLGDEAQNHIRSLLLALVRHPILDGLPSDSRFRHVQVEASDLPELYLIPCGDFYRSTGTTFQLANVVTNLTDEGMGWGQPAPPHKTTVEERDAYMGAYNAATTDEHLILVAANEDGPWTIIDGTHRAAALRIRHEDGPSTPWKAILIDSPSMTDYQWHIESAGAAELLQAYKNAAASGHLT